MMEQTPLYSGGTISASAAAALLGCAPITVRRMAATGELPGYRAGPKALVIDRAAVERMVAQRGGPAPFKPGPKGPRKSKESG